MQEPDIAPPVAMTSSSAMSQSSAMSEPSAISSSAMMSSAASSQMSSSGPRVVKKGQSTKKQSNVNVDNVLASLQLVARPTDEASLLALTVNDPSLVKTMALLRNNDRALLFAWAEGDQVKTILSAIKQALQDQFSGKLSGLVDETRTQENGPPYDILSFTDPAISTERIIFLRVRNRLYEIHVAANGADVVDALLAALTK